MKNVDAKPRLKIKIFGSFDIMYDDQSIFFDNSSNIKSIMLMRFLIANRSKAYSPEKLSDLIWPDHDYLDVKKVIRTYIHRLRKFISEENKAGLNFDQELRVINIKGNYKMEISDHVEIDTDTFENFIHFVRDEDDEESLKDLFDQFLDIYSGKFLEEEGNKSWVIALRNEYTKVFCTTVNHIFEKLEAFQCYDDIITMCEKTLKIYELDEKINICYMRMLMHKNELDKAYNYYSYITSKLYNELSIMPSEDMRSVYAEIKSAKTMAAANVNLNMSQEDLILLINNVVKTHLDTRNASHSALGYVKIIEIKKRVIMDEMADDILLKNAMRNAFQDTLRKNDMFAVVDKFTGLIYLNETQEDFYIDISNRIRRAFFKNCDPEEYQLKINIIETEVIESNQKNYR